MKFTGEGVKKLSEASKSVAEKNEFGFTNISSTALDGMLKNKDFTLIDVHTPEQEHIPGTDYMISYDEVEKIASKIPNKKPRRDVSARL